MATPTADAALARAAARRRKMRLLEELNRYPYHAPWWARGPHLQTAWAPLFRRLKNPPLRNERLRTPDGDFLDLHFLDGDPVMPTVLLLHGLEGSVESKYVIGLNHEFYQRGWNAVTMEFRSCGGGLNQAPRLYHLGETTDIEFVARTLIERNPAIRLYVAGVSLGGNVTAKWLGEQKDAVPSAIRAAAIICPPFDLLISGPYMDRPTGLLYTYRFLRTLIPKALEKERQFPGNLDPDLVRRSKTFADFDTHATARLHGFRDAQDYWAQCSCGRFLEHVRIPTLVIAAEDDPFNPPNAIPRRLLDESPYLIPQITARGGHTGFVYSPAPWKARYWAEEHTARFFEFEDRLAR